MIKGINRRIVEVRFPESRHFEKAVVFLRADCPSSINSMLAREAEARILSLENKNCNTIKGGFSFHTIFEAVFRISVIICAAAVLFTHVL